MSNLGVDFAAACERVRLLANGFKVCYHPANSARGNAEAAGRGTLRGTAPASALRSFELPQLVVGGCRDECL
jgi:hypothetical protein